ncbi:MAG: hypothetical protein IT328_10570 [Caldilineaceae bacterium]|nr:hypothetical protein [Caldilineaceae bacterium]
MTSQLNIPFETLVALVEQLPAEQQQLLLQRIQSRFQNGQTVDEKMKLLRAVQVDVTVNEEPSLRREDWYDDDGR